MKPLQQILIGAVKGPGVFILFPGGDPCRQKIFSFQICIQLVTGPASGDLPRFLAREVRRQEQLNEKFTQSLIDGGASLHLPCQA